jgi:hypothetical protein
MHGSRRLRLLIIPNLQAVTVVVLPEIAARVVDPWEITPLRYLWPKISRN